MAKNKKIKTADREGPGREPKKKIDVNLLKKLVISFVVILGVYFAAMNYSTANENFLVYDITLFTYIGAETVLGSLYVIFNKGISNDVPKESDLPDDWSEEQKTEFIEKRKKDRARAKKVLIFLLPVTVALFIEVIIAVYF